MKYLFLLLVLISTNAFALNTDWSLGYPYYPDMTFTNANPDFSTDLDDLCTVGYTKGIRQFLKKKQKKEVLDYYKGYKKYGKFELDHNISLEIGGSNDIHNFWPQPYQIFLIVNGKKMRMGAREKDVVETNLHRRFCNNDIDIKEAQGIIINNWVTYYLKLKNIEIKTIEKP